jgi:hypothetical protein
MVQFAIFVFRRLRKAEPFFHARDLPRSHCKKVVKAFLLTELVAPPSVADETERSIATVTSSHDRGMRLQTRGLGAVDTVFVAINHAGSH